MIATDLADYLVAKGVPFRETHALAGKAVRQAASQGLGLESLSLPELQQIHPAFAADVFAVFDPLVSVSQRRATGGTAPEAVRVQLEEASRVMRKRAEGL